MRYHAIDKELRIKMIEVKNVSYVYSPKTPFETVALKDVSITFEEGKITGLIGHTGSGKSTLVQLLNGLEKPSSGHIIIDERDIWEKPKEITKLRFSVGLVMQYPEYQLFDETVEKDIGFGPRNMGLSKEEIHARVVEAAVSVGIGEELLEKSPFDLSGGQKRRVAIAGVLAMRPKVLILDEPAAGLDPRGRKDILGSLREYQQKNNATVILVSHSMEDMAMYCDNIVVMNGAEVLTSGPSREVFSQASLLTSVGLDAPQISKIAEELIALGYPLEGDLYTVGGVRDAILRLLGREVPKC